MINSELERLLIINGQTFEIKVLKYVVADKLIENMGEKRNLSKLLFFLFNQTFGNDIQIKKFHKIIGYKIRVSNVTHSKV